MFSYIIQRLLPPPSRRFACFHPCPFVGLSAGLHKNYTPDFYDTWMEDGSQPRIGPHLIIKIVASWFSFYDFQCWRLCCWLGWKLINTLRVTSDLPPACSSQMLFDCRDDPHGHGCLDPRSLRFCNFLQCVLWYMCRHCRITDLLCVIDVFCSHYNFICNSLLIKELQPPPTLSDTCLAPCRSVVAWNLHRWNASIFYLM